MYFSLFLHFYQPPTQYPEVLRKITRESYIPILEFLEQHPQAKVTANFASSLSEQLLWNGYKDIIDRYAQLVLSGQLELVSSAAYHPILPKIPKSEIYRQVFINDKINSFCFGNAWKLRRNKGFFPPEIAYSKQVGEVITDLACRWVLLSESSFPDQDIPDDSLYKIKKLPLFGFFRDNELSLKIAFGQVRSRSDFKKALREHLGKREYIIAAMDGETFGHHLRFGKQVLEAIFEEDAGIKFITVSGLLEKFDQNIRTVNVQEATWGTTLQDKLAGRPYPRWDLPSNPLHKMEWELLHLAVELVNRSRYRFDDLSDSFNRLTAHDVLPQKNRQWLVARELLDRALNSDLFWWSSNNPYWHPGLVEEGLTLLSRVISQVPNVPSKKQRRASYLINKVKKLGRELFGEKVIGGVG